MFNIGKQHSLETSANHVEAYEPKPPTEPHVRACTACRHQSQKGPEKGRRRKEDGAARGDRTGGKEGQTAWMSRRGCPGPGIMAWKEEEEGGRTAVGSVEVLYPLGALNRSLIAAGLHLKYLRGR